MSDQEFLREAQNLVQQVLGAQTKDFSELAKIAGLNPTEDFAGADLSHILWRSADLRGANLRSVNFSDSNLSGANLSSADLSKADLNRAILSGADLNGANL